MPETVEEWVRKAEGDYRVALRESAVADEAAFDAICFHTQQCIEKLMKAVLLGRGVDFPRTHNLLHLDSLVRGACPGWYSSQDELEFLTRTGIAFRYPGVCATAAQASRAIGICKQLRDRLKPLLESS